MSRLTELKATKKILKRAIKTADEEGDTRNLAPLVKQYRETLKDIEEIEGAQSNDDEIGTLLASREADGKSGAVRQSRA